MVFKEPQIHNFGQVLRESAARFPDKTAIVFKGERCTYRELEEASNRVASAMAERGVRPGDKVGIISPNRIEYLEVVFACAKLGAITVKLNWRMAPKELLYLLEFNQVKLLFYSCQDARWGREIYPALMARDQPAELVELDLTDGGRAARVCGYAQLKEGGRPEYPITFFGGESPLMHLHTGGTTGFPKCVVYGHKRYIDHVAANAFALGFTEDLVFQTMSQLFHSASLGVYAAIFAGGTVVLFDRFDAQEYLAAAERERSNRLSTVPTVLHTLMKQPNIDAFDLSAVRTIGYGSAPMQPKLIEDTIKRLPNCGFMQSYGMTEMGATVTILSAEDHVRDNYRHLFSVGKPIPGARVRVVDERGRDCPPGVVGEIVLKGYNMMLEYWRMPQETAEAIVDGWYCSKDMGFLDEEGFLTVSGRKNDLIITGAENVFPAEVERVISEHEAIEDVCVLGVPDEHWGERVVACVVPKRGQKVTEEELKTYCRRYIAGYKVPKQILILEALAVNALGKVDKGALARLFTEQG